MKFFWGLLMVLTASFNIQAAGKIHGETVEYKDGDTVLEGYLAYQEGAKGKKPTIMISPNWMGLTSQTKELAKKIADMGYVAFAMDIYGKGVRPKNQEEAGKVAGSFKDNRKATRERVKAAFDYITKNKMVDQSHMVAVGYCFGGMTVLEMGRSGFPLAGIVTFHGALSNPNPADAKNFKSKVAVFHGAIDPFVPFTEVENFEKEMNDAGVDYQLTKYSGAVHSFTDKDAGNDPKKGQAYNEKADRRSWVAFQDFLAEVAPAKK
jgi:dienelactone hydrolase